ncbi:hypothetical protein RUMHYD_01634 [Blautia hydrogenotrophica DSM 10507]|uniref:Uncharacterized protein n=1 Tax=Blautia hydrogenotrophica (strain DSM 10507 / JCM 14656 / S5a33) TaxID=476272 RepID=C0CLB3_BLAHS|nr:hypothetical protein RUMHYD_01634 [Blautia hydrogenotrophica DSM 10507]
MYRCSFKPFIAPLCLNAADLPALLIKVCWFPISSPLFLLSNKFILRENCVHFLTIFYTFHKKFLKKAEII